MSKKKINNTYKKLDESERVKVFKEFMDKFEYGKVEQEYRYVLKKEFTMYDLFVFIEAKIKELDKNNTNII